ncbi:MAG: sulfotransferase [Halioglobus sp.]|nr:sulfotransferase [Halioglobus sp.]
MLKNITNKGDLFPGGPPFDLGTDEGNPIILSREGLSLKQVKCKAEELKAWFPNARILCIVREQRDLLATMYVWRFTNDFMLKSLRQYLASIAGSKYGALMFNHVVLEHYESVFGKENILVIPYELLRENSDEFFRTIADFSGSATDYVIPTTRRHRTCKRKASLKAYTLYNIVVRIIFIVPASIVFLDRVPDRYRRRYMKICKNLHRFSRRRLGPLMERLFPDSEKLAVTSADIAHLLPDIARSNDLLAKYCHYDLEHFGYITTKNLQKHLDDKACND